MVEYDEEPPEYDGNDFDGPSSRRPRRWRVLFAAVALIVVVVLIASLVLAAGERPHPVPVTPPYRA
jgi:anti-sigma-K factor RskA